MRHAMVSFTAVLLLVSAAAVTIAAQGDEGGAEPVVQDLQVVIPFSNPWGHPPPGEMWFSVPPGTYYITLAVDRASWDVPGVADAVPIGLGAYAMDRSRRRYNRQPWRAGLGLVSTQIYVSKASRLFVVFSTSAPLGARGILNIVRIR